MTKRLFTYGIALALLAGCSADDTATPGSAAPGATDGLLPVRLTIGTTDFRASGDADHTAATRAGSASGVADHAATRATSDPHTAFAAGEEVYLSVRNDAATTASPFPGGQIGTSETTTRTIAAATVNSGVTGFNETLYYPENGHTFDLCAIYPNTANSTITVAADQSTAEGYQASDLLYAYVAGIASTQRTTAQTLTFRHMMALLRVTMTVSDVQSIESVKLVNVARRVGTITPFNTPETLMSGIAKVSDTSSNPVDDQVTILGSDASPDASYTVLAVLPPQTLSSTANLVEVRYKDEGGDAQVAYYRLPSTTTLNSGIRYDMAITLSGAASDMPLTLELTTAGSTTITFASGYEYRTYTSGAWNPWTDYTTDITLSAVGDKVQFRGTAYPGSATEGECKVIYCSRNEKALKVYGNVMSLVNKTGYGSMTTMTGQYNFRRLFYDNRTIEDASGLVLPATTLTEGCYQEMFLDCKELTSAPALPATDLTGAPSCYKDMFHECKLSSAPALPATTLSANCYDSMFRNCPITTAPALPASTLTPSCYNEMFRGTSLTSGPTLAVTNLTGATSCYAGMFTDCKSLTTAPALPATTLAEHCYESMFNGCTSLVKAPELPALTLVTNCYESMFKGCEKLNEIHCLATDISASSSHRTWVQGVSDTGVFYGKTAASWGVGADGIPKDWTKILD